MSQPNDPAATNPAPQRRVIVHIGLNKTGSSTIQSWLGINVDALRAQNLYFDELGPPEGPELNGILGWAMLGQAVNKDWLPGPWQRMAYGVQDRDQLDKRIGSFLARAEKCFPPPGEGGTFIISSEFIGTSLRVPRRINALHSWLSGQFDQVTYLVYIRDQLDWVPSAYTQAIRSGEHSSLDDFIGKKGENDYAALLSTWIKAVGKENFVVRLMARDYLTNSDLIEDFAGFVGADTSKTARPDPQNESLSRRRLQFARFSNKYAVPFMRKVGLRRFERHIQKMPLPFCGGPKLRLNAKQSARVAALNDTSNEQLRAAIFPERPALFVRSQ
ncbi:MAG: hypothetical protein JKX69_08365 [Rhodobacteraceae bacterium]|nr:hypothetical protein [Paracoccaceae bacterium]